MQVREEEGAAWRAAGVGRWWEKRRPEGVATEAKTKRRDFCFLEKRVFLASWTFFGLGAATDFPPTVFVDGYGAEPREEYLTC